MIPSYDFVWGQQPIQRQNLRVQMTLTVYSPTLNTRVTFFWLPKINEDLFTRLKKWESGAEDSPSVIVLGWSSRGNSIF